MTPAVQTAEEPGDVVQALGQDEGGPFAGGRDRAETGRHRSGAGVDGPPAEGAVQAAGGTVGEGDMAEGALLRTVFGPVPQMVREGGFVGGGPGGVQGGSGGHGGSNWVGGGADRGDGRCPVGRAPP